MPYYWNLVNSRPGGNLIAALAGTLLPLSLAPFGLWPLAFVSILLLLIVVRGQSIQRSAERFYLHSLGMNGAGASWIFVSVHVYGGASVLLAGFLVTLLVASWSLIGLLHGYLYGRFIAPGKFAIVLGFPALWVLVEWFRGWFLTGFPWLYLGYGQVDSWLVGYAPVSGVLALSFFSCVTAGLIFDGWIRRSWRNLIYLGFIWLTGYGLWQVTFVHPQGQLIVAAVQGNVDQHTKWRRDMVMPIIRNYLELTENHWGADLIVWPEAAVTLFKADAMTLLNELDAKGKHNESTLLLGIPARDEQGKLRNTAMALGAGQGEYHKRRLVPFGEYVPLEDFLRGIIQLFDLPMSRNTPGADVQTPITAGKLKLSLSICYEVIYPELVRTTVDSPDLLVTISNDTWFGTSIGPLQHMQMAQMRAIENGRFLLRATNNGVTALVNHRGEPVSLLPRFEPGVLSGTADIMHGLTPFHRFGQLPLLVFCASLLVLLKVISRPPG